MRLFSSMTPLIINFSGVVQPNIDYERIKQVRYKILEIEIELTMPESIMPLSEKRLFRSELVRLKKLLERLEDG